MGRKSIMHVTELRSSEPRRILITPSMQPDVTTLLGRKPHSRNIMFRINRSTSRGHDFVVLGNSAEEVIGIIEKSRDYAPNLAGVAISLKNPRSREAIAVLCDAVLAIILSKIQSDRRLCRKELIPFVFEGNEMWQRIVMAFHNNVADKMIAMASVIDSTLYVRSCNFRSYVVPIDRISALNQMPPTEYNRFEILSAGSRIHWNCGDVDLSLDNIRYIVDPGFQREAEKKKRMELAKLAKSIRRVRKRHQLRQGDCGITDREMRRIERGEVVVHSKTLEKIAAAHKLTLSEYLREISSAVES